MLPVAFFLFFSDDDDEPLAAEECEKKDNEDVDGDGDHGVDD